MTAPGGNEEHRVIFKAIADFSNLSSEARKARAELQKLKDQETRFNEESTRQTADLARIKQAEAKAYADASKAVKDESRAIAEHTTATKRDAEATERATAQERVRAERQKAVTAGLVDRSKALADIRLAERETNRVANEALRERHANERKAAAEIADLKKQEVEDFKKAEKDKAQAARINGMIIKGLKKEQLKEERAAAAEERVREREEAKFTRAMISDSDKVREALKRAAVAPKNDWERLIATFQIFRREMGKVDESTDKTEGFFKRLTRSLSAAGSAGGGGGIGTIFTRIAGAAGDAYGPVSKFAGSIFGFVKFVSVVSAIQPLIAVIGSLGSVALGVASSLGSLAGAALALPGLLAAAVGGIAGIVVGFQGIGGVLKAFTADQKAAGTAASGGANQQAAAIDRIKSAENSLVSAQEGVKSAQEGVNKARQQAIRDLDSMRERVAGASLDEEGATISLKRAQENYKAVAKDAKSSALDRQEALYGVKRAEEDLKNTRKTNTDSLKELNAAEKKGVEGSDSVVQAKKSLSDSLRSAEQATRSLEAAQRVEAAGSKSANTAANNLKYAMDQLSPSARKVAEFLLANHDALKKVQQTTQEALFKPVVFQLGNLKALLPVVTDFLSRSAGAMGDVAAKGIAMMASGPWRRDFGEISKNNVGIIHSLGDAALSVVGAFKEIAIAAAPFTQWIADGVKHLAQDFERWAAAGRESGSINRFLDDLKPRLRLVGDIFHNLLLFLVRLGGASLDFGDDMLTSIDKVTAKWADWAKKQEEPRSKLKKYFEDIKPLLSAVAVLFNQMAIAFGHVASDPRNLERSTGLIQKLQTEIFPKLGKLMQDLSSSGVLEKVITLLGKVIDAVDRMVTIGASNGLSAFVGVMSTFVSGIEKLLSIPHIGSVIGAISTAFGVMAALSFAGAGIGLILDKFILVGKGAGGIIGVLRNAAGLGGGGKGGAPGGTAGGAAGGGILDLFKGRGDTPTKPLFVFVTNQGGVPGGPGGTPGKPGGPGGAAGKASSVARGAGLIAAPVAAGVALHEIDVTSRDPNRIAAISIELQKAVAGLPNGVKEGVAAAFKSIIPGVGDAAPGRVELGPAATGTPSADRSSASSKKFWENVQANITASNKFDIALRGLDASIKKHGTSLDTTTVAGKANAKALQDGVSAAVEHGRAVTRATGSEAQGVKTRNTDIAALREQARHYGINGKEFEKLTRGVLARLKVVPSAKETKLKANVKSALDNIAKTDRALKNPRLTAEQKAKLSADRTKQQAVLAAANKELKEFADRKWITELMLQIQPEIRDESGRIIGRGIIGGFHRAAMASGGPVGGSGGPTQDNIPLWASVGEYVINAMSAKKHRPLIEAINADKMALGGPVNYASHFSRNLMPPTPRMPILNYASGGSVTSARASNYSNTASVNFGDTHISITGADDPDKVMREVNALWDARERRLARTIRSGRTGWSG